MLTDDPFKGIECVSLDTDAHTWSDSQFKTQKENRYTHIVEGKQIMIKQIIIIWFMDAFFGNKSDILTKLAYKGRTTTTHIYITYRYVMCTADLFIII